MTLPPAYDDLPRASRVPVDGRVLRDLFALLLVLIGAGGGITCAFLASPLLGWGVLCALAVIAGLYLATDR